MPTYLIVHSASGAQDASAFLQPPTLRVNDLECPLDWGDTTLEVPDGDSEIAVHAATADANMHAALQLTLPPETGTRLTFVAAGEGGAQLSVNGQWPADAAMEYYAARDSRTLAPARPATTPIHDDLASANSASSAAEAPTADEQPAVDSQISHDTDGPSRPAVGPNIGSRGSVPSVTSPDSSSQFGYEQSRTVEPAETTFNTQPPLHEQAPQQPTQPNGASAPANGTPVQGSPVPGAPGGAAMPVPPLQVDETRQMRPPVDPERGVGEFGQPTDDTNSWSAAPDSGAAGSFGESDDAAADDAAGDSGDAGASDEVAAETVPADAGEKSEPAESVDTSSEPDTMAGPIPVVGDAGQHDAAAGDESAAEERAAAVDAAAAATSEADEEEDAVAEVATPTEGNIATGRIPVVAADGAADADAAAPAQAGVVAQPATPQAQADQLGQRESESPQPQASDPQQNPQPSAAQPTGGHPSQAGAGMQNPQQPQSQQGSQQMNQPQFNQGYGQQPQPQQPGQPGQPPQQPGQPGFPGNPPQQPGHPGQPQQPGQQQPGQFGQQPGQPQQGQPGQPGQQGDMYGRAHGHTGAIPTPQQYDSYARSTYQGGQPQQQFLQPGQPIRPQQPHHPQQPQPGQPGFGHNQPGQQQGFGGQHQGHPSAAHPGHPSAAHPGHPSAAHPGAGQQQTFQPQQPNSAQTGYNRGGQFDQSGQINQQNPYSQQPHPGQQNARPQQPAPQQMPQQPGWYPDPNRRAEYRWFDGNSWTGYVATGGIQRHE